MKKFNLFLFSVISISSPALASFTEHQSEDQGGKTHHTPLTMSSITFKGLEINEASLEKSSTENNAGILQLRDRLIVDGEKLKELQSRTTESSAQESSFEGEFLGLGKKTDTQLSALIGLPTSEIQDIDKSVVEALGAIINPHLSSAVRKTHSISFKSKIQSGNDANYYTIDTDILRCEYQKLACYYIIQKAILKPSSSKTEGYPVKEYIFSNSLAPQDDVQYRTLATFPQTINDKVTKQINAKIQAAINAGPLPTGTLGVQFGKSWTWDEQSISMMEKGNGRSGTGWHYSIHNKAMADSDLHVQHEWIWAYPSSAQPTELNFTTTLKIKYNPRFWRGSAKETASFSLSF